MDSHTPNNPVCSEIKEDIGDSSGNTPLVNAKAKYFIKRVPDFGGRIAKPWYLFRREDNGDYIFSGDFKTEELASAECRKRNGLWSLYHPDFPNPHKCCDGLWVPNKHDWEHALSCPVRKRDLI